MAASDHPVDVLQLRMVLRGINPLIWRRFLVRADSTIADLHYTIQIVMGWEDLHLHSFHIRGRDYGLYRDGGLWFDDDANQVTLSQLGLRPNERFAYEYDMGDMWVHELRLERVVPLDTRKTYPQCIGGKRAGPPEDCGGAWAYMELRDTLSFHSDSDDWSDWEELYDDDDERPDKLYSGFDPEHFSRKDVNRALRQWLEQSSALATGGNQS